MVFSSLTALSTTFLFLGIINGSAYPFLSENFYKIGLNLKTIVFSSIFLNGWLKVFNEKYDNSIQ
jgi:hypothetical protein